MVHCMSYNSFTAMFSHSLLYFATSVDLCNNPQLVAWYVRVALSGGKAGNENFAPISFFLFDSAPFLDPIFSGYSGSVHSWLEKSKTSF